ncbi:MAG: serpin family protein [Candidatus Sericytochromatia bacterium]|nr:serpin family protein [Candidatus Sericytochromatia bacterium]
MTRAKIAKTLLTLPLLSAQLLACQPADGQNPAQPGQPGSLKTLSAPSAAELQSLRSSELPEANTRFALAFFGDLLNETPRENVFISPLSLSIALSMLYQGASGETRQEIADALRYSGLSEAEINAGNLTLRKRLQNSGKGVTVQIANALWGKAGLSFNAGFLSRNQAFYDARLEALDFGSATAVARINQWASDNTNGLIPKVIEEIDPMTILILMNAIYFKGDWSEPFEASQTQERSFYKADGTTLEHPMMQRYDKFRYTNNTDAGFEAVSLPYGEAEETEMILLLPHAGKDLASLRDQLTPENWQSWLSSLRSRDGSVTLPKFKLKTERQLNDTLRRLGMVKAFSEAEAEFDSLLDNSPLKAYVSEVKQDAFIDVNEKGTEAAAVTTITVGATSIQLPQEPFEMVLDRPFLYAIYDRATESLLFMGALNSPEL